MLQQTNPAWKNMPRTQYSYAGEAREAAHINIQRRGRREDGRTDGAERAGPDATAEILGRRACPRSDAIRVAFFWGRHGSRRQGDLIRAGGAKRWTATRRSEMGGSPSVAAAGTWLATDGSEARIEAIRPECKCKARAVALLLPPT